MTTTNKLWLPLLLLLTAALWIGGCSDSPTNTTEQDGTNLVDDFGGYKTTSEEPGFGDDVVLADDELEVVVNDPMLASPEVTALTSDTDAAMFHFRAVWGQIPCDTLATDPIDWTGSLTINQGAAIVRRTIRFEEGQDYLLDRTEPTLVEWVSTTTIANDGIALDLFFPLMILDTTEVIYVDTLGNTTITYVVDTIDPGPVTVTFETGPYSRTFSLEELAALDTIVELDNGTSVAFHAMQLFRTPCPGGFVIGGWGYDNEGQGQFRGRWMNYSGEITGWLGGHFGTTKEGQNMLFAKWINQNGDCEGFIKGLYQRNQYRYEGEGNGSEVDAGGEFHARVYNAYREPIGELHGQYQSAAQRRNGFFQGRWRVNCNMPDDAQYNYDDGFEPLD